MKHQIEAGIVAHSTITQPQRIHVVLHFKLSFDDKTWKKEIKVMKLFMTHELRTEFCTFNFTKATNGVQL